MSSTQHTGVARYHLEHAWPKAVRLALVALLFLGAIVLGLTMAATSAPSSPGPQPPGAPADGLAAVPETDDDSAGPGDGGQGGDEPVPDPEPEPDPDPDFTGPDDLAPNPAPEPTPPDDFAPNPDPDPDAAGPDDVSAEPEPGTLKVHPNFASVTLQDKGYESGDYVCFGNPGDLAVNWIVNDGVVIKSNPLNGTVDAGGVTCPWVWTDHPSMEPGMTTNVMFESETNFILIEVTLAD